MQYLWWRRKDKHFIRNNNLDFDMGIGETNLTANLNGESSIDAGGGNVNITLLGKK